MNATRPKMVRRWRVRTFIRRGTGVLARKAWRATRRGLDSVSFGPERRRAVAKVRKVHALGYSRGPARPSVGVRAGQAATGFGHGVREGWETARGARYYAGQGGTRGDIPAMVAGPEWRPDTGFLGRGPLDTTLTCETCGYGPEDHEWHDTETDGGTSGCYWDSTCEHYMFDIGAIDASTGYGGGGGGGPDDGLWPAAMADSFQRAHAATDQDPA